MILDDQQAAIRRRKSIFFWFIGVSVGLIVIVASCAEKPDRSGEPDRALLAAFGNSLTPSLVSPQRMRWDVSESTDKREQAVIRAARMARFVSDNATDRFSIKIAEALGNDEAVGIRYRGRKADGGGAMNGALLTKDGRLVFTSMDGKTDEMREQWWRLLSNKPRLDVTESLARYMDERAEAPAGMKSVEQLRREAMSR